jgi:hypothetical protein
MTLLTEPTRIVLAKGYSLPDDADAVAYIAAVEAADGQALETATRMAINSFVKGCKADGIWPAIKASCILAGARTLTGALIPLAGTAPTNVGPFVSGDYNRKTGLVGDGSTKCLNSNRNNNADPQNSKHFSAYASVANGGSSIGPCLMGAGGSSGADSFLAISVSGGDNQFSLNNASLGGTLSRSQTGFIGSNRNSSASFTYRPGPVTISALSGPPSNNNIGIFNSLDGSSPRSFNWSTARIAFYSIGESLDLALLDTRVTTLINAFAAAIP